MGLGNFSVDVLQSQMRESAMTDIPKTKADIHTPEYRDSETLDPQTGGEAVEEETAEVDMIPPKREPKPVRKPQPKKKSEKVVRKPRSNSDVAQIRDFPKELLAIARSEFPTAMNNTDALAAYVYAKSGGSVPVSDTIKELVSEWDGDHAVEDLSTRVGYLEKKSTEMMQLLEEMELLISYLLFDRMGYRKEQPKSLRSIDMLESDGAYDIMKRAKEQTRQLRKQRNIDDGRPKE